MKTIIIILLCIAALARQGYGQVGRYELPNDTIPIGGQQQERKETRMEGKEQVAESLVALRDSVNTYLSSLNDNAANVLDVNKQRYNAAMQELTEYKASLMEMIDRIEKQNWDDKLSERSYAVLQEVRKGFKRIKEDLK